MHVWNITLELAKGEQKLLCLLQVLSLSFPLQTRAWTWLPHWSFFISSPQAQTIIALVIFFSSFQATAQAQLPPWSFSLLSSNSSLSCCCFSHFLSSLRTWTRATLILFFSSSPLFSSTYYYSSLSLISSPWVVATLVLLSLLSSLQVVAPVLPFFPILELELLPF